MMFLRNLVLVTLLAASSALGGYATTCKAMLQPNKRCIDKKAYKACQKKIGEQWYTPNWYGDYDKLYKQGKVEVTDCTTSPAMCLLSFYQETTAFQDVLSAESRTIVGRNGESYNSEYDCFQTIAKHECMFQRKWANTNAQRDIEAAEALQVVSGTLLQIGSGSQTTNEQCVSEERKDMAPKMSKFLDEHPASLLVKLNALQDRKNLRYGTSRKTIETAQNSPAKNSQKTTGSSDNTVLIVVVALLSVFALAVGVWVGRLSSEMKIPQDAQLGPVTVETV